MPSLDSDLPSLEEVPVDLIKRDNTYNQTNNNLNNINNKECINLSNSNENIEKNQLKSKKKIEIEEISKSPNKLESNLKEELIKEFNTPTKSTDDDEFEFKSCTDDFKSCNENLDSSQDGLD